jgi:hypothetical protein
MKKVSCGNCGSTEADLMSMTEVDNLLKQQGVDTYDFAFELIRVTCDPSTTNWIMCTACGHMEQFVYDADV